jgi:hypothetical protein
MRTLAMRRNNFIALLAGGAAVLSSYFVTTAATGELIIKNGSPPIDPASYTTLAAQSRFDQSIALVRMQVLSRGRMGPPEAFCSGTLVSPNIVLTAAHCVSDVLKNGTIWQAPKAGLPVTLGKKTYTIGGLLGPDMTSTQTFNVVDYIVNPTWVSETHSGTDLAVLLVGSGPSNEPITMYNRNGVLEAISFVPLYTGSAELTQPFPDIGVPIGYGNSGDGLAGEQSQTAGTKRGCLVLMMSSSLTDALSAKFLTRSELYNLGAPSNFLECQMGHGDSGGGIFQQIGTNRALVLTGVTHSVRDDLAKILLDWVIYQIEGKKDGQPTNAYDANAYWQRVSSNVTWVDSAITSLGGDVPPNDPGP